jgi:hypothetical protein
MPPPAGKSDEPADAMKGICDGLPRVRVIYLVPSDKQPVREWADGLKRAVLETQSWVRDQLGTGQTFCYDGSVEIVQTPHAEAWYMATPSPRGESLTYWDNVAMDAHQLTGATYYDPNNIWAIYVDVEYVEGQALGAVPSFLIQDAGKIRGLSKLMPESQCAYNGGNAHEVVHTFGVGHSPGCAEGAATCDYYSLMWMGYRTFPMTHLIAEHKTALAASPFFLPITPELPFAACAQ